jgi:hypothetical protein
MCLRSTQQSTRICEGKLGISGTAEASSLADELFAGFQSGVGTDITFVVEGKPLRAHRFIVASRCPYFRAMWHSGMQVGPSDHIIRIYIIEE